MMQEDITPSEALEISHESRKKTEELVASVERDVTTVREVRLDNNWANKVKAAWLVGEVGAAR